MYYAIAAIIIALLAYTLYAVNQIKPPEHADPTRADIEAPVAELGKNIPVLFGTVLIQDANVAWWGDFSTKAIKTKGKK